MPLSTEISEFSQHSDQAVTRRTSLYMGTIPPPEMVRQFAEIDPTFPERLFRMAETENIHRQKMEIKSLNAAIRLDYLSNLLGAFCVIIISALSYLFMKNGNSGDGKTIAIFIICTLTAIFVLKRIKFRSDHLPEK